MAGNPLLAADPGTGTTASAAGVAVGRRPPGTYRRPHGHPAVTAACAGGTAAFTQPESPARMATPSPMAAGCRRPGRRRGPAAAVHAKAAEIGRAKEIFLENGDGFVPGWPKRSINHPPPALLAG